jgi:hypothetical protein
MFELVDRVADEKTCGVCGQPLLGDPDDQPFPPLGPMDGECYRARQFDEIQWEKDWQGDEGDG